MVKDHCSNEHAPMQDVRHCQLSLNKNLECQPVRSSLKVSKRTASGYYIHGILV